MKNTVIGSLFIFFVFSWLVGSFVTVNKGTVTAQTGPIGVGFDSVTVSPGGIANIPIRLTIPVGTQVNTIRIEIDLLNGVTNETALIANLAAAPFQTTFGAAIPAGYAANDLNATAVGGDRIRVTLLTTNTDIFLNQGTDILFCTVAVPIQNLPGPFPLLRSIDVRDSTFQARTGSGGALPLGTQTQGTLTIDNLTPPSFVTQPTSTTGCTGGTASFTVGPMVNGNPPPTLQWRRNSTPITSSPLPGGTIVTGFNSTTLMLSNLLAADAGTFDCVASNSTPPGTATSNPAVLTVNPPSVFTPQTVTVQQSTTLATATLGSLTPIGATVSVSPPAGITVTGITNTAGTVTAMVSASCTATVGANPVPVIVTGNGCTINSSFTVMVTPNSSPMLGAYPLTGVCLNGTTSVMPAGAPTDNGRFTLTVGIAPGTFTGTATINQTTGVVSITNAGPAGTYSVSVTAIDNCNAISTLAFSLTVNPNPTMTPGGTILRQQGSGGTSAILATVSGAAPLSVVATPPAGITIGTITINSGVVTATVAAACQAPVGNTMVPLTVTDGNGCTATSNFLVTVTANTPPTLGSYPAPSICAGTGLNITPDLAPTDNGILTSLTASAPGFTGSILGNTATGILTITNAGPANSFTVTVTATDNCGATATTNFTLNVTQSPSLNGQNVTRQSGTAPTLATIGTVSGTGTISVTTGALPTGITVTGITNSAGTITALVGAGCTAALGNNSIPLMITSSNGCSSTSAFTVNVTANSAPTLGTYANASLCNGNSTTVTPSSTPSDNGTISLTVNVTPNNFSGTVTVNSLTGAVSIANAGPVGTFTVTITATDGCNATTASSFALTVGGPVFAGTTLTRQQGSTATTGSIGTITGIPPFTATVTTPNGISVTSITVTGGTVTASIGTSCTATLGNNLVPLTLMDGAGCMVAGNFIVNVITNTAPTQGQYLNVGRCSGTVSATRAPSFVPTDNGSFTLSVRVTPESFTGTASVDSTTGEVTLTNLNPPGTYSVTVFATDSCGLISTASFTLAVNTNPGLTPVGVTRQQGTPGTVSTIANIGSPNPPFSIEVGTLPQGISVNETTITGTLVAARVTAGCAASTGVNLVPLTVRDANGCSGTTSVPVTVASNVPPTIGAYPAAVANVGGGTLVLPATPPFDSGGMVVSVAATASTGTPGSLPFTGTLSGDATTGGITISGAGPVFGGTNTTYTINVVVSDNCGAISQQTFGLTVIANTPPTFIPSSGLVRQQGSPGITSTIGTVSDLESASGNLSVVASSIPPGVSVFGVANTNGTITATITAGCSAPVGNQTVVFTVTDEGGLSTTGNVSILINPNSAPTIGTYAGTNVIAGNLVTIVPTVPPADNGSVAGITVAAPVDYGGSLSIHSVTGVVSANPINPGVFPFTVTVTDNCGTVTTSTFTLTVLPFGKSPLILSFDPGFGPFGTAVTLTGYNFSTVTSVSINGKPASFTVNSNTQITFIVPIGASTGPITVTSPSGTTSSGTSFTVVRNK
ncbi:MAG: immunoglobulin domain-containing protein [Blastocatellia bacterium]|nr:immunoglobulin domain-containing protein [Blastocatellia bacterium]